MTFRAPIQPHIIAPQASRGAQWCLGQTSWKRPTAAHCLVCDNTCWIFISRLGVM